jgi:hypothetical protein
MLCSSQREPETRRPRISSEILGVRSIPSCRTERIRTERSPRRLSPSQSAMVRGAHAYSSARADPRSRGSRTRSMSSTSRQPVRLEGPRSHGWSGGLQFNDRRERTQRQEVVLPPHMPTRSTVVCSRPLKKVCVYAGTLDQFALDQQVSEFLERVQVVSCLVHRPRRTLIEPSSPLGALRRRSQGNES